MSTNGTGTWASMARGLAVAGIATGVGLAVLPLVLAPGAAIPAYLCAALIIGSRLIAREQRHS